MFANFIPKIWLSSEISNPKTWHAHPRMQTCTSPGILPNFAAHRCMIKIFKGEGVVDGKGGSSEGCLQWSGGGIVKGSLQKHLKTRGG